ncbi:MAG: pyridoxamine 5'-phosphate oxidase [Planctomycetota bacterium]
MAIQDLRQNYTPEPLDPADLLADPFDQFLAWFKDAQDAGILEPNAFTLATASADGIPNARTVLLKGVDNAPGNSNSENPSPASGGRGFVFYTNYDSTKGHELSDNPRACLNFYWDTLSRCVRVPGRVTKVSPKETEAYFHSRPRGSQLGAWTSHQSTVIADRRVLSEKYDQLNAEYPEGTAIPVPPTWGGYRIVPDAFEFWQGQPSRLHDRLRYTPRSEGWKIERLSP